MMSHFSFSQLVVFFFIISLSYLFGFGYEASSEPFKEFTTKVGKLDDQLIQEERLYDRKLPPNLTEIFDLVRTNLKDTDVLVITPFPNTPMTFSLKKDSPLFSVTGKRDVNKYKLQTDGNYSFYAKEPGPEFTFGGNDSEKEVIDFTFTLYDKNGETIQAPYNKGQIYSTYGYKDGRWYLIGDMGLSEKEGKKYDYIIQLNSSFNFRFINNNVRTQKPRDYLFVEKIIPWNLYVTYKNTSHIIHLTTIPDPGNEIFYPSH